MERLILAIDQGTTSSRAILFDRSGMQLASASRPVDVSFPADGWVEQDPAQLWQSVKECVDELTADCDPQTIAAIGITNQRETVVAWSRQTGAPLAPAIVWQCRRTEPLCARLRAEGRAERIRELTGLVIDPYFSASKIHWMLENVAGLRARAEAGEVVFGTVDSWVLYNLTKAAGAPVIATEPSNASRTMLCSLRECAWNEELLAIFGVKRDWLPTIHRSAGAFGVTRIKDVEIPITGMLGDQQAALFGHRCFSDTSMKCTFGTGAFLLRPTGTSLAPSVSGLLNTVAWQLSSGPCFAYEGSVFVAGALIQWLRDGLNLFSTAAESELLAAQCADSGGVVIVPAFVGLGAPYWNERARGAIFGLTRDAGAAQLCRAALEAVAHQVADLCETAELEAVSSIRIDGGMSRNRLFCQILADLTGRGVAPAALTEMTAAGAAAIAALGAGLIADTESLVQSFFPREIGGRSGEEHFRPSLSPERLLAARSRWKAAITGTLASVG